MKNNFKKLLKRMRMRKFSFGGYTGWAIHIPSPDSFGGVIELSIDVTDGDITKGQMNQACGYIRRALIAYKKQGGE